MVHLNGILTKRRIAMYENKPWLKFYENRMSSLDYLKISVFRKAAEANAGTVTYVFFEDTSTCRWFLEEIGHCADMLAVIGLRKRDSITISMPTSPQGLIGFYAANKIGAVARSFLKLGDHS